MPHLRRALPRITFFLIEEKTPELLHQLEQGALDCALLALPVPSPNLTCHSLFHEAFTLAVSADHRLAQRRQVTLEDLRQESMLLVEDGHCLRSQALAVCDMISIGEANHFRATSLETLRHMVAAGDSVTLIPQLAVNDRDPALRYIPFKSPAPSREIGLCWRATSARTALFHSIGKLIAKHYRHT